MFECNYISPASSTSILYRLYESLIHEAFFSMLGMVISYRVQVPNEP